MNEIKETLAAEWVRVQTAAYVAEIIRDADGRAAMCRKADRLACALKRLGAKPTGADHAACHTAARRLA